MNIPKILNMSKESASIFSAYKDHFLTGMQATDSNLSNLVKPLAYIPIFVYASYFYEVELKIVNDNSILYAHGLESIKSVVSKIPFMVTVSSDKVFIEPIETHFVRLYIGHRFRSSSAKSEPFIQPRNLLCIDCYLLSKYAKDNDKSYDECIGELGDFLYLDDNLKEDFIDETTIENIVEMINRNVFNTVMWDEFDDEDEFDYDSCFEHVYNAVIGLKETSSASKLANLLFTTKNYETNSRYVSRLINTYTIAINYYNRLGILANDLYKEIRRDVEIARSRELTEGLIDDPNIR